jgi:hypothetical protein
MTLTPCTFWKTVLYTYVIRISDPNKKSLKSRFFLSLEKFVSLWILTYVVSLLSCFILNLTEHRGWMTGNPASYSGDPGFIFLSGGRLFWQVPRDLPLSLQTDDETIPWNWPRPLFPHDIRTTLTHKNNYDGDNYDTIQFN